MENIKNIISQFFLINNKEEPEKEQETYIAWKKTVEKNIFKNTEIIKIEKNKIFIKAINGVYRNEISFKKNDIIKKINKHTKNIKIKEIIIRWHKNKTQNTQQKK